MAEVAPDERIRASLLNLARICELDARLVAASQIQISESRELLLRANAVLGGNVLGRIARKGKVLPGAKSCGASSGKIDCPCPVGFPCVAGRSKRPKPIPALTCGAVAPGAACAQHYTPEGHPLFGAVGRVRFPRSLNVVGQRLQVGQRPRADEQPPARPGQSAVQPRQVPFFVARGRPFPVNARGGNPVALPVDLPTAPTRGRQLTRPILTLPATRDEAAN